MSTPGEGSSAGAAFDDEVRAHDAAVRARGLTIWIGAEPTFSRRDSQEPVWLSQPEGGDKLARARALLRALAPRLGRGVRLMRVGGRQFPDEDVARFAFGALWTREGLPGYSATDNAPDNAPDNTPDSESAITDSYPGEIHGDLPDEPPPGEDALKSLPPPPAARPEQAFLTVTPDPGVVEVNMAPARDLREFLAHARAVYAAARDAGLSPERFRYNGHAGDSGGGGQVTLGGPDVQRSPFFVHPHLLPNLLRYFNRHPALSFLFASECVGGASQGPRPDEGVRERFDELPATLDWLASRIEREGGLEPRALWEALSPLLVDCSGNSHRAEINIEKLFNPFLEGRGCLGVVEFRALRMPRSPERLTAVAALLRAVAAMLAPGPYREPLIDHGAALHDRFALPHFLLADLGAVLADLDRAGLGLGPGLRAELTTPPDPRVNFTLGGDTLTITPALEFWPLLGDVASQERAGARLVDSSTERVEILVTLGEESAGDPGIVLAAGRPVPLHVLPSEPSPGAPTPRVAIAAVRFRAFQPRPGLHPGLPVCDPLVLTWQHAGRAVSIAMHGWIPGGGIYEGLPDDASEAARRRRERVVVTEIPPDPALRGAKPTNVQFAVDLRRPAAP